MSKTVKTALDSLKVWPAAKIKAQQDQIAVTGVKMLEMIRENAEQCLAHFKAHGDITLAERLLASLPNGMVVAGLAKWFKDFAPVKFDSKGKAEITDKEKIKDIDLEAAQAKNWVDDSQVQDRANRPIEPFNPAMIKGRIKGMLAQLKKAEEPGGRGFGLSGQTTTPEEQEKIKTACYNLVNNTIKAMDTFNLTVNPEANVVEMMTGKKDRVSRRGNKAEGERAAA